LGIASKIHLKNNKLRSDFERGTNLRKFFVPLGNFGELLLRDGNALPVTGYYNYAIYFSYS